MDEDTAHLSGLCGDLAVMAGFSRPAGQCFAGIWRAAQAPCAEDLVRTLGLSRSNISTALKELRQAGLIATARAPGDRKDYFVAPSDPWDILRAALAARRRRDLAPLIDRFLAAEARAPDARLAALHEMMAQLDLWLADLVLSDGQNLAKRLSPAAERLAPRKKKKKGKKS